MIYVLPDLCTSELLLISANHPRKTCCVFLQPSVLNSKEIFILDQSLKLGTKFIGPA